MTRTWLAASPGMAGLVPIGSCWLLVNLTMLGAAGLGAEVVTTVGGWNTGRREGLSCPAGRGAPPGCGTAGRRTPLGG